MMCLSNECTYSMMALKRMNKQHDQKSIVAKQKKKVHLFCENEKTNSAGTPTIDVS